MSETMTREYEMLIRDLRIEIAETRAALLWLAETVETDADRIPAGSGQNARRVLKKYSTENE